MKSSDLLSNIIYHSVVPSQQASLRNCYSGNTEGSLHVAICYSISSNVRFLLHDSKFPPRVALKYTSSTYVVGDS
jgi:hypothetical protein